MSFPSLFQKNGGPVYNPPPGLAAKKIRLLFIDRTLKAMAGLLEEFIFSEAYAQRPGILQKRDARAKLLGVLILIVSTSLLHSITLIYALYGVTLILTSLSRIEAIFFIKRVWLVLPLFSGIIALPAT